MENKAWTENKRSQAFGPTLKKMAISMDSVDSKKAWTQKKHGLEKHVESRKAWTRKRIELEARVDSKNTWSRKKAGTGATGAGISAGASTGAVNKKTTPVHRHPSRCPH